jgi:hypothetical protein
MLETDGHPRKGRLLAIAKGIHNSSEEVEAAARFYPNAQKVIPRAQTKPVREAARRALHRNDVKKLTILEYNPIMRILFAKPEK